jgi:hypothetical protein
VHIDVCGWVKKNDLHLWFHLPPANNAASVEKRAQSVEKRAAQSAEKRKRAVQQVAARQMLEVAAMQNVGNHLTPQAINPKAHVSAQKKTIEQQYQWPLGEGAIPLSVGLWSNAGSVLLTRNRSVSVSFQLHFSLWSTPSF